MYLDSVDTLWTLCGRRLSFTMADAEPQKSRGLKFAERQLVRHGWERGKGLGRDENGISEAIKVKVKCDKGGVGHKEGDQFSFHWWDHVFNKTSSSLQVESDQSGMRVRKNSDDEGGVSNKKPLKSSLAKEKLYGAFVKSATLVSGQERSVVSDPSASSSSDEDEKLDLSTTTKISDAQLVEACGGRTAHKGARHGLNMSAKLARLQQQEAEFMAKYGKKTQEVNDNKVIGETKVDTDLVKSKKKKKNKSMDCEMETASSADVLGNGQTHDEIKIKRKKKKKEKDGGEEEVKVKRKKSKNLEENSIVMQNGDNKTVLEDIHVSPLKKKKKKSKE